MNDKLPAFDWDGTQTNTQKNICAYLENAVEGTAKRSAVSAGQRTAQAGRSALGAHIVPG